MSTDTNTSAAGGPFSEEAVGRIAAAAMADHAADRLADQIRTLLNAARELDDLARGLVEGRLEEEGRQPVAPPPEVLDLIASWEARAALPHRLLGTPGSLYEQTARRAASQTYQIAADELRAAFGLPPKS